MELSAYEIVKKIHKTLTNGDPTISDAEVAYITGLLDALLTTYNPDPVTQPGEQKHTFLDGVKDKLSL